MPFALGIAVHKPELNVTVISGDKQLAAVIYCANSEMIDPALQPCAWYLQYTLRGAIEHQLPVKYVQQLRSLG